MYAEWVAPDGTVIPLTPPVNDRAGWLTPNAIAGWGATPVELVTDDLPAGGTRVRHVRTQPRTMQWPLHIWGGTHQRFIDVFRFLTESITQTRYMGAGVLRVSRPDGRSREIDAYYSDGLGGDAGQGDRRAEVVVSLYCPDGFWRDSTETVVSRKHAAGIPYLNPYPTVSAGQVLGETTIVNPGQVDGWPTWTITGPLTSLRAVNQTTGEEFTLTHTLTSPNESITIVTGGEHPTLRDHNGQNLNSALNWPGAVLWPLVPRDNAILFDADGSGPGTEITLAYFPRYEMA